MKRLASGILKAYLGILIINLLWVSQVWAEGWVQVGGKNKIPVFFDTQSVTKQMNTSAIDIWLKRGTEKPRQIRIDCQARRFEDPNFPFYMSTFGAKKIILNMGPVQPDTEESVIFHNICTNPKP